MNRSLQKIRVSTGGIINSASSLCIPPMDPTGTQRTYWAATHANLGSLPDNGGDSSGHSRSRHAPTPSSESDFLQYSAKHELPPAAINAAMLHEMRWEPSMRGARQGNSRRSTRMSQKSNSNSRRGTLAPRAIPSKSPPQKPTLAAEAAAQEVGFVPPLGRPNKSNSPPLPGGLHADAPDSPPAPSRAEQAKALVASTKRASKWSSRNLEAPRPASPYPVGAAGQIPERSQSPPATRVRQFSNGYQPFSTRTAPMLESGASSILPDIRPSPAVEKANVAKAFEILLGGDAAEPRAEQTQPTPQPARPTRMPSGAARPATYTPASARHTAADAQHVTQATTITTMSGADRPGSGTGSKSTAPPVGENTREISFRNAVADLDSIVRKSDPDGLGVDSSDGGDVLPLLHDVHDVRAGQRKEKRSVGTNIHFRFRSTAVYFL